MNIIIYDTVTYVTAHKSQANPWCVARKHQWCNKHKSKMIRNEHLVLEFDSWTSNYAFSNSVHCAYAESRIKSIARTSKIFHQRIKNAMPPLQRSQQFLYYSILLQKIKSKNCSLRAQTTNKKATNSLYHAKKNRIWITWFKIQKYAPNHAEVLSGNILELNMNY